MTTPKVYKYIPGSDMVGRIGIITVDSIDYAVLKCEENLRTRIDVIGRYIPTHPNIVIPLTRDDISRLKPLRSQRIYYEVLDQQTPTHNYLPEKCCPLCGHNKMI